MQWCGFHQPHPQAPSFVLVGLVLIHLSVLSTGSAAALCVYAGVGTDTRVTHPQGTLVQLIPLLPISKADKIAAETATTAIHASWVVYQAMASLGI